MLLLGARRGRILKNFMRSKASSGVTRHFQFSIYKVFCGVTCRESPPDKGGEKMDEAARWAVTVCVCAVVSAITELAASGTKLEKNIRLLLGLMMLSAVIIPLGTMLADIGTEGLSAEYILSGELSEKLDEQRELQIKEAVADLIAAALKNNNCEPEDIEVIMDINEDGCISIIRAKLILDAKDAKRAPELCRTVKNELGIECKTVITEA